MESIALIISIFFTEGPVRVRRTAMLEDDPLLCDFTKGPSQSDFTKGPSQSDFTKGSSQSDFTKGSSQSDFTKGSSQSDFTVWRLLLRR